MALNVGAIFCNRTVTTHFRDKHDVETKGKRQDAIFASVDIHSI